MRMICWGNENVLKLYIKQNWSCWLVYWWNISSSYEFRLHFLKFLCICLEPRFDVFKRENFPPFYVDVQSLLMVNVVDNVFVFCFGFRRSCPMRPRHCRYSSSVIQLCKKFVLLIPNPSLQNKSHNTEISTEHVTKTFSRCTELKACLHWQRRLVWREI